MATFSKSIGPRLEFEEITDGCTGVSSYFSTSQCSFTWTIQNFSKCNLETGVALTSPTFQSDESGKLLWALKLYPNGVNKSYSEYVSLCLVNKSRYRTKVKTLYSISLLSKCDEEVNMFERESIFVSGAMSGAHNLKRRSTLLGDEREAFLPNDELTMICDLVARAFRNETSPGICSDTFLLKKHTSLINLSKDIWMLSVTKKFSDITLRAEGKEVKAHKLILAARSAVFNAMFQRESSEESILNYLDIDDLPYDVLARFINYLYSGFTGELTMETAMYLFDAADKYMVFDLKETCEEFLKSNIDVDNVVDLIAFAKLHNESDIKEKAIDFVIENRQKVFAEPRNRSKLTECSSLAAEILFAVHNEEKVD